MLINDRNVGYNIKDCDASLNQNAHTFNNASCNVRKRSVANITSDKKLSDENVDKVTNSNRNSSRTQTNSNFNIDTSNQYDVLAENTNGDASIQDDENTNGDASIQDDENTNGDASIQDDKNTNGDASIQDDENTNGDASIQDDENTNGDASIQDDKNTNGDASIQDDENTNGDASIQDDENTNGDASIQDDENTNGDASIQDDENIESENDRENKTKKKRSITILGDSIVKEKRSHKMRRCTKQGEKIYIKTFPGATTECMNDYVNPTMKYNPDFVILHTGTNDLKSNKSSEEISDDIIKLALDIKTDQNDIVVSGILARNDDMKKSQRGK